MKVPMADLKAQHGAIRSEIDAAVRSVIDNCQFILGDNVRALEAEIASYCGARYAVAVNSGTDALTLALAAVGVGPGDEVITTSFTFVATTEVIALLGAKPVYGDVNRGTFNLDPGLLEAKVTPHTKAILPVHLYGQPADVLAILDLARRHRLRVVWDAAQAIGAEACGKPIGAYGDVTTLSFYPTKNLGGAGDGGMVLTNDPEIAERLKYLRFHGSGGAYSYRYVGYCSRLDEIQAAILRVKLPYLGEWTATRRRNAETYAGLLADLDVVLPIEISGNKHVYQHYTIRHRQRDGLREDLGSKEIETGVYYPGPLHLEEAYRYLGYRSGDFPEAERACREVLSLPVHPDLTEAQIAYVCESIRRFCKGSE